MHLIQGYAAQLRATTKPTVLYPAGHPECKSFVARELAATLFTPFGRLQDMCGLARYRFRLPTAQELEFFRDHVFIAIRDETSQQGFPWEA